MKVTASSAASVRALAALAVVAVCASGCKGEGEALGRRGPMAAPVVVKDVVQKPVPVSVKAIGSVEAYTTV